jgi:WD40 repeat protein
VIGGPSCDPVSRIIWWQVRSNNIVGWTAEGVLPDDYFVDPIGNVLITATPAVAPALPIERTVITPGNVINLAPALSLPVPEVSDIAFSGDQSLVALGSFGGAFVYMLPTLFEEPMLTNPLEAVTAVAFSSAGRYFAYGTYNNIVTIADVEAAGRVSQLANPPTEGVNALVFSPDDGNRLAIASGALYGGGGEETVSLYDVGKNALLIEFDADYWVNGVAFSPDGTQLAWMDTALHIFEIQTGDEILNSPVNALGIGPVAYTPDGSAVAYADGYTIVLMPLDQTGQPQVYEATSGLLPATIAFNPAGTLLAVVSVPGVRGVDPPVISIFDVDTGDVVFETGSETARTLAFSPDGTLLLIAESDKVNFLVVP